MRCDIACAPVFAGEIRSLFLLFQPVFPIRQTRRPRLFHEFPVIQIVVKRDEAVHEVLQDADSQRVVYAISGRNPLQRKPLPVLAIGMPAAGRVCPMTIRGAVRSGAR